MILVAGATGHLGAAVVEQLLRSGATGGFAVLARDPEKAKAFAGQGIDVRIADYDRPETLRAAFSGVDKLLFISTMAMNRAEQQSSVVDAAAAAGVKHIVYTGLALKDIESSGVRDLMISHFQTEDRIKASGMAYTFLRNTMYADAMPIIAGPQATQAGIFLPAGQGKVPYVLRAEMGEATANLLLQEGHEGRTYDIVGEAAYGYDEVARSLSALTGRSLAYHDVPAETLRANMQAAGLPEFPIYLTLGTLQDIKAGRYEIASPALRKLLGRTPKSLDEMVKTVFSPSL